VSVTVTLSPAARLPSGALTVPRILVVVSCAFPATGMASIMIAASAANIDPENRDLLIILNPRLE
jgi:hypothetical protein